MDVMAGRGPATGTDRDGEGGDGARRVGSALIVGTVFVAVQVLSMRSQRVANGGGEYSRGEYSIGKPSSVQRTKVPYVH